MAAIQVTTDAPPLESSANDSCQSPCANLQAFIMMRAAGELGFTPSARASLGMIDESQRSGPCLIGEVNSLNQDQQRMLVEQLVAALQSRGEGIHISELSSVLKSSDYLACTPQALLSIATQDPQLTANVGKYLYLAAWGHARRENVIDALRATLEQARSPLTIDEVVARVETRLKRGIVRTCIYSRMQAIGAKYEPATQTWALPEANDTAEEEFIDADSVGAE